jgi:hypothetical protein
MTPFQAELRELIRRLNVDGDRVLQLEQDVAGLRTGVRDLWSFGGAGGGFRNATISGVVRGCWHILFRTLGIQASLSFRDPATGVELASGTTDSVGNYGPISLAVSGTSQNLTLIITPASTRVATYVATQLVNGGPNTVNYTLNAATGFRCWFAMYHDNTGTSSSYPIAKTLNVNDSRYGTSTIVQGANFNDDWTSAPGASPFWVMQDSQRQILTTIGGTTVGTFNVTALTVPDITTKLSITWTWPVANALYAAGDTITITEP